MLWVEFGSVTQINNNLVVLGFISQSLPPAVRHNSASKEASVRLYGITKWANENKIDLMMHIHFNDDANHSKNIAGKYSGFALYIPIK